MDFTVTFLLASYGWDREHMIPKGKQTEYDLLDNLGGFVWFSDKTPKAYNVMDAGNALWGYTMKVLGFTLAETLKYANANENGNDASADQRAISNGFKSTPSVRGPTPTSFRSVYRA